MLALPETLMLAQANACLQTLGQGIAQATTPTVEVDASALQNFDSAALAVLLECRRLGLAREKQLSVVGMPARLVDLAQLYGVSQLLFPAYSPAASAAVVTASP